MDYTYIKENCNNIPKDKEEFIEEFVRTCKAFDIDFIKGDRYKTQTEFLLDMFGAMMRYQRGEN